MKLLLDTHVVIWALQDSPKLPIEIRDMICEDSNSIYVSVISLWEIAIKHKNNPEKMPYSATQIRDYCQRSGYIFLSLSLDNVTTYEQIDFEDINNDPFDRMLVSQSESNNMVLLTHDEKIEKLKAGRIKLF